MGRTRSSQFKYCPHWATGSFIMGKTIYLNLNFCFGDIQNNTQQNTNLQYAFNNSSYIKYYFYLKYLDDSFNSSLTIWSEFTHNTHTGLKFLLSLRKHAKKKRKRKCGPIGKEEAVQLNLVRSKNIYFKSQRD